MSAPFDGFDLQGFWDDSAYAREHCVDHPLTDALVSDMEAELGVRLPRAYVHLMRTQNGGVPRRCCFRTETATSWAPDHIEISSIAGIGRGKPDSLGGSRGSRFMQDAWGYPKIGVCICGCPSAGHDVVMLDYRECGPRGEPRVVHVDQEREYEITRLAKDFESFIRGLVDHSEFDTSAQELRAALDTIEDGTFTTALGEVIGGMGPTLRSLCHVLTKEKGGFALHGDPLSRLVYDLLFHVYSGARPVRSAEQYLAVYPDLIVFGDGSFRTRGYAPNFVAAWMKARREAGDIIARPDGTLALTEAAAARLLRELASLRPQQ